MVLRSAATPLASRDIVAETGLSHTTVNRRLKALVDKGIIEFAGRKVVVGVDGRKASVPTYKPATR